MSWRRRIRAALTGRRECYACLDLVPTPAYAWHVANCDGVTSVVRHLTPNNPRKGAAHAQR